MSHAQIAALPDGIRNQFASAHPSLPDKAWLGAEAHKLVGLVEALPDPVTSAYASAAAMANTAQVAAANAHENPPEPHEHHGILHAMGHLLHLDDARDTLN